MFEITGKFNNLLASRFKGKLIGNDLTANRPFILNFASEKEMEEFYENLQEQEISSIPLVNLIKVPTRNKSEEYEIAIKYPDGSIIKTAVSPNLLTEFFSQFWQGKENTPVQDQEEENDSWFSLFVNSFKFAQDKESYIPKIFVAEEFKRKNPFASEKDSKLLEYLLENLSSGNPKHQNTQSSTTTCLRSKPIIDEEGKKHHFVSVVFKSDETGKFDKNTVLVTIFDPQGNSYGKAKCFVGNDGSITINTNEIYKPDSKGEYVAHKPDSKEKEAISLTHISATSIKQDKEIDPQVRWNVYLKGKECMTSENNPKKSVSGVNCEKAKDNQIELG